MKYTIESTEDGCIETLTLSNGKQYTKKHVRTDFGGTKTFDSDFWEQMEKDSGIYEEILDAVCDTFDSNFAVLDFMDIAEHGL